MDSERAIVETIEFDNAIAAARDFAEKKGAFANRPGTAGDTTIIVTADHECAGFSLIGAAAMPTAALKALTADKKQAAVGTYDLAKFPSYKVDDQGYPLDMDPDGKLLIGFGANGDRNENWMSKPRPIIDSLLPADLVSGLQARGYLPAAGTGGATGTYGTIKRDADLGGYFIAGQVPGDNAVHTASDIPLSAMGPGWKQFIGVQDNTDVFFKLAKSALGGYPDDTPAPAPVILQGDLNNDGKIDIKDAVLVLRKAVGLG